MAKNISLLGANYPDVPAVVLPQTGGGTATFTDVSGLFFTVSKTVSADSDFNIPFPSGSGLSRKSCRLLSIYLYTNNTQFFANISNVTINVNGINGHLSTAGGTVVAELMLSNSDY